MDEGMRKAESRGNRWRDGANKRFEAAGRLTDASTDRFIGYQCVYTSRYLFEREQVNVIYRRKEISLWRGLKWL